METHAQSAGVLPHLDGRSADSWERFAVFPARVVVLVPPQERQHVHTLGEILYDVILGLAETAEPEPGADSALLQDYQALIVELQILNRILGAVPGLNVAHDRLTAVLREAMVVLEDPPDLEEALPRLPFRPFLLTLVPDEDFLPGITVMGSLVRRFLGHKPSPAEETCAWAEDLVWIQTVLVRHLANRGEMASLGPGESRLCRLADRIAERLQEPIELLNGGGVYR